MRQNLGLAILIPFILAVCTPGQTSSVYAPQCRELFSSQAPEDQESAALKIMGDLEDAAVIAKIMDEEAMRAVEKVLLTNQQAKAEVRDWFLKIRERQEHHAFSIMEHSALLHILRSDFLVDLGEPELIPDIKMSLVNSWQHFTGKTRTAEDILSLRLPKSVLRQATQDEELFHSSVFDTPRLDGLKDRRTLSNMRPPEPKQILMALGLIAVAFHKTGRDLLAGAVMGYTISSLVEYTVHRYSLHASSHMQEIFKKTKWLGGDGFLKANLFHSGIHHASYREYTTPFSGRLNKEQMDKMLKARGLYEEAQDNKYGTSMGKDDVTKSMILAMGIAAITTWVIGFDAVTISTAMPISNLTIASTKYLHGYLHLKKADALAQASVAERWIINTRFFAKLARRHYVHHEYADVNYNLFLPGIDWLTGKLREPNIYDIIRMIDLDIIR
jgi:hypothetical protein